MATAGDDWDRQQRRIEAEAERERRAAERAVAAESKQREQMRVSERKDAAQLRTAELEARVAMLRAVLRSGLGDVQQRRTGPVVEPDAPAGTSRAGAPRNGATSGSSSIGPLRQAPSSASASGRNGGAVAVSTARPTTEGASKGRSIATDSPSAVGTFGSG